MIDHAAGAGAQRKRIMNGKIFGIAIGFLTLSGCVPPAPAPVAVAPPAAVAVVPAAAPVALVPTPAPPVHRHVAAVPHRHPAQRHHAAHAAREARYVPAQPGCGTTAHPCNVEHTTAPVQ